MTRAVRKNRITVSLSDDEALVLFELLSRFAEEDTLEIGHPSEEEVVNRLLCGLKSVLIEPFDENYGEVLLNAQVRIRKESKR